MYTDDDALDDKTLNELGMLTDAERTAVLCVALPLNEMAALEQLAREAGVGSERMLRLALEAYLCNRGFR